jgi:uncharacterized Zn finger protein (UPF0148 family)
MICPKCQSTEIDSSGTCPVCGVNASEAAPPAVPKQEEKSSGNFTGLIELDYSSPSEVKSAESSELPQWRRDLARRLQEIRQKREAGDSMGSAEGVPAPPPVHVSGQFAGGEKASVASSAPSATLRMPRRTPRAMRSEPY